MVTAEQSLCSSVRWLLIPTKVAASQRTCPPLAMLAIARLRSVTAPLYSLTFLLSAWTAQKLTWQMVELFQPAASTHLALSPMFCRLRIHSLPRASSKAQCHAGGSPSDQLVLAQTLMLGTAHLPRAVEDFEVVGMQSMYHVGI